MHFPVMLALATALASPLVAVEPQPVLLELFTSQGCSSCPPAEALFKQLDESQPLAGIELIPLVFHVDYWDRLGWKDLYADKAWTRRQYAYAGAWNTGQVYTPQAVVNGSEALVGHDRKGILAKARPVAPLQLSLKNGVVEITGLLPGVPLWMALTEDGLSNAVPRGENEGRTLLGHGVVRLLTGAKTDGTQARWPLPKGSSTHAIAFQQEGLGPVLAAGRLKQP